MVRKQEEQRKGKKTGSTENRKGRNYEGSWGFVRQKQTKKTESRKERQDVYRERIKNGWRRKPESRSGRDS